MVVSCRRAEGDLPSDENDYTEFLRQAQEQAAKYYSAFCDYEIALQEEGLTRGCRLSQDVNTYYNKDAQPLTIIQLRQEAVKDYPQARTDETWRIFRIRAILALCFVQEKVRELPELSSARAAQTSIIQRL